VKDARVAGAAGIEGVIDDVVVLVVIEVDDDVSRDALAGRASLRGARAPK
jgi:hypothetical protein